MNEIVVRQVLEKSDKTYLKYILDKLHYLEWELSKHDLKLLVLEKYEEDKFV